MTNSPETLTPNIPPGHALKVYHCHPGWRWTVDEVGFPSTGIVHEFLYDSFAAAWCDGIKVATLAQSQGLPQVADAQVATYPTHYIPF